MNNFNSRFFVSSPLFNMMEQVLDNVGLSTYVETSTTLPMKIDAYGDQNNFVVEAQLPGYQKEQIKIQFIDKGIHIIAESKEVNESKSDTNSYFHREIKRGKQERFIRFPYPIDEENIKASFTDGILKVVMPKKELKEPKNRFIDIE